MSYNHATMWESQTAVIKKTNHTQTKQNLTKIKPGLGIFHAMEPAYSPAPGPTTVQ